jgi:hypothetical protein
MSAHRDFQNLNSSQPAEGPRISWMSNARKLKSFLSALAAKQLSLRRAGLEQLEQDETVEEDGFSVSYNFPGSYLQKCCDRVLDAHTVEDAIFWHSEIINELSVEIYTVNAKPWPDAVRLRTIADLSERQSRHGEALHRLTGIVARNEQLTWQP